MSLVSHLYKSSFHWSSVQELLPASDFYKNGSLQLYCSCDEFPHDNTPQSQAPPNQQQPSSLNMVNLKETVSDEAFEVIQNIVPLFMQWRVLLQESVGKWQSPHCPKVTGCFFLSLYPILPMGDKTLMETLANRVVYIFEAPGIEPWVYPVLGKHSYWAVSTAPQMGCF